MSEARRTAEALASALDSAKAAAHAAGRHRFSGGQQPFAQHVTDLHDLMASMAAIHTTTRELAKVAKSCADKVRAHYFYGESPSGSAWPEDVKRRAAEADRALSKLRSLLTKVPARASHDAVAYLRTSLRDMRHQSTK